MFVKYVGEGSPPLVGSSVVTKFSPAKVKNESKLKEYMNRGYEFIILKDGEWVDAEEYFNELESTKVTAEITVEEDTVEDDTVEEELHQYDELFSGHWATQVNKIKDYTEDVDELYEIYEYGVENGATEGVLDRIQEYINELKQ